MTKYRAKKTEYNGKVYDSKKEANRAWELDMLQRAGEITDLRRQVRYKLEPAECSYVADFVYKDRNGKEIVEDVKGYRTREYKIKKALMKNLLGVEIFET